MGENEEFVEKTCVFKRKATIFNTAGPVALSNSQVYCQVLLNA
jgi:hypothetical protein